MSTDANNNPPKQVSTTMFWMLAIGSIVWLIGLTILVIVNMSSDNLSDKDIADVAVGFANSDVVSLEHLINILSRDDLPDTIQAALSNSNT